VICSSNRLEFVRSLQRTIFIKFSSDWPETAPLHNIRYLDIDCGLHDGKIAPTHGLTGLMVRNPELAEDDGK